MRKILLLGVCLAAAAGGTSIAQAADANVTSGLSLKINGWIGFMAGLSLSNTADDTFDRDYDFISNARLQFDVKNVTDSGLEYGARIRMNNVDRRNDVTIDRTYLYVKGGFGTVTFGDAPYAIADFGYVYAHDTLNGKLGLGAGWGDGLDGKFNLFGGSDVFYAVDPSYGIGGLNGKDTKIKYTSPSFSGFSFGVDFTPVAGGNGHAGNGGRNDLTNDSSTRYENIVTAGVQYTNTFDGSTVTLRGSAGNGNGVVGNHDYEAYSLGGQFIHASGFAASVNWVHFSSTFRADKAIDSITGDLSYYGGPYVVSVGYAYTTAEKGNELESSFTDGEDLKANHSVIGSLLYNLAPGLNSFAELAYERNEFRFGKDYEATALTTGLALSF
ncbi:porin [Inquilinus limosus]|uniref:porin n=1 Tax=Inquilinus limosus TaxID=171674 RepID=UPI0009DB7FF8|nr:porin [Inquilinus limosus]